MKEKAGALLGVVCRSLALGVLPVLLCIVISGCGAEDGNSSSSLKSGQFIDSPVEGLQFHTETQSGITDRKGTFHYRQGEWVSFRLGDVVLGQAQGKETITPIDLVPGAQDETDPTATNICRLLQSLDEDGDVDNGITISSEVREEVGGRPIDVSQSTEEFESDPDVAALLATLNSRRLFQHGKDRKLRSKDLAQYHMRLTLATAKMDRKRIETAPLESSETSGEPLGIPVITRRLASDANRDEVNSLVAGNNGFALEIYQRLKADRENLVLSPYTVSMTMAMTYGGACEETALQMSENLRFFLDQELLHPAFNHLDVSIQCMGQRADHEAEDDRFMTSAAAWGQRGSYVAVKFFNLLAANYDAPIHAMDFLSQPADCEVEIDEWVEKRTHGLIPSSDGSITDRHRLVFAATASLNAPWRKPFPPESSFEGNFKRLDGTMNQVPMMSQVGFFPYMKGDGYAAVELPMEAGNLTMLILLPEEGTYEEFENNLTLEGTKMILQSLRPTEVDLRLPRFSFLSGSGLNEIFSEMGLSDIMVEERANFCRVNPADRLHVKGTFFRGKISVAEAGAQGAGSALVGLQGLKEMPGYLENGVFIGSQITWGSWSGLTASSFPVAEVAVGHPFIFLVRDTRSGAFLFMGRVLDP